MTHEQALARIAELEAQAQKQALDKQALEAGIHVGKSGQVTVGIPGRWPVTLKRAEWTLLFTKREAVEAFLAAHPEAL